MPPETGGLEGPLNEAQQISLLCGVCDGPAKFQVFPLLSKKLRNTGMPLLAAPYMRGHNAKSWLPSTRPKACYFKASDCARKLS